jgi:pimeloyl-ACP methyl ester carboxylesterase
MLPRRVPTGAAEVPTIVLVHGAFADASGFRGLYDELLGEDVTVVAPPNPLRGLSGGDGDYLKAVIDEIGGPVLLVGHSYGGSVITAAGQRDGESLPSGDVLMAHSQVPSQVRRRVRLRRHRSTRVTRP